MIRLDHTTDWRCNPWRRAWCGIALLLPLCLAGCRTEQLPDTYGEHRKRGEYGSVNGTDVLAGMFTAAGHEVYFRRTLVTSEMEAADVIVWFPDDQDAPRDEVCEWLDEWLTVEPDRVVIYVGRHFSAAPLYWKFYEKARRDKQTADRDLTPHEHVAARLPTAGGIVAWSNAALQPGEDTVPAEAVAEDPAEEQSGAEESEMPAEETPEGDSSPEVDAEPIESEMPADEGSVEEGSLEEGPREGPADEAESSGEQETEEERDPRKSLWFDYQAKPFLKVKTLDGPWAAGIDAAKTEIELSTRLVPNHEVEKLLWSGSDEDNLIVSRWRAPYWDSSQVLFVVNGSFTLNLPLVNHENRKLAGRLVAEVGRKRNVVFLESGPGGPLIDPPPVDNSIWTLFEAWPLGAILLQLAVVGVMFGFVRWPIFGRPKQPPPPVTSDFSEHVEAVGKLIARTKDRSLLDSEPAPPASPNP
jgi:hypothetical protein